MMPYVAIILGACLLIAVLGWLLLADDVGRLDERPKLKQLARGARRTKGPIAISAAVVTGGLALWWFGREKRGAPTLVDAEVDAARESRERVDDLVDEGATGRRDLIADLLAEADAIDAEAESRVSLIRASAEGRAAEESAAAWRALNEGRD